jgi:carbon-monoxide dehydrogenase large subunit
MAQTKEVGAVSYVGESIPMMTSTQLVAGKGTFVDDVQLPGMTYMAVLRSPYASALIRSIDASEAESLPGVICVITGDEIKEKTNAIPETYDTAAVGAKGVDWYALCIERARYVGEAVAAVIAEDRFTAYEALDLIDVDYEELPAVSDAAEAIKPGSPLVEPEWGDNVMASRDIRLGDPDAAFAEADGIVEGVVKSARITGAAIEPRGCLATYDPYKGKLTFWDSTQAPHPVRMYLAKTLGVPDTSIHVIQPNVGGAFGLKLPTFQEEPLCAYASMKIGRPVKWIESRSENLLTGGHARDTSFTYKVAYKNDGEITGIKLDVLADIGVPSALCGWGMSFVTWYCLPCVYKCANSETHLRSVVTNKCPWNAYRGYGKDAASMLMERIMDRIAKATGIDRAQVRFRNFVQPEEFPYPQVSGAMLDSGDYPAVLQKLLDMVDYEGFPKLQAEARAEGRRIGLGIAMELTPEGCSMPGSLMLNGTDSTEVRVTPEGNVIVLTGVTSPGSGNETGIAQIVAAGLHCDISRVSVIQGDTESCPWGFGNYSSRSIMIGGSAGHLAAEDIHQKMLTIAANMLEVAPEDVVASRETFDVRGAGRRGVTFESVAREVYSNPHGVNMDGIEPMLQAVRQFKQGNVYHQPETQGRFSAYPAWPYGAAAAVVEVDEQTGHVKILRYCLIEDAGTIVNPLLVNANLHGGIAQGIGGAMYERLAYDSEGQPLTATFMDYTLPTAVEVPNIELGHQVTPAPFTPLGTKGVGESGVGGALGSLCSAIEDALPEYDLDLRELPLTPNAIWSAIEGAKRKNGAGANGVAA